jgi:hypothetical protein
VGTETSATHGPRHSPHASGVLDKEAWLRVAGEWIKLAQATEQRRR